MGEIYFKIDRNRAIALAFLKQIDFANWLNTAEKMFASCSSKWLETYSSLKNEFNSVNNKHIQNKVAVLNEIHVLAKKAITENLDNTNAVALAKQLTDEYLVFAELQFDYNTYVHKVNHALEGKFSGVLAKVLSLHQLDVLSDLTIL